MTVEGNVVVVGRVAVDVRFELDKWPTRGGVAFSHAYSIELGGKTLNVGVAARRMGAKVTVIAPVANDLAGNAIVSGLRHEDVDTDNIITFAGSTPIVGVLIESNQPTFIPPNVQEYSNDLLTHVFNNAVSLITDTTVVVANFSLGTAIVERIFRHAKNSRATTILNPVPVSNVSLAQGFWKNVDFLVPNLEEAKQLHKHAWSTEKLADEFIALGVHAACITLGENGSFVRLETGEALRVNSYKVKVVDPTGGSDAFCAALAVACLDNSLRPKIWDFASIAGALACSKAGSTRSMPTREEVLRYLQ